MLVVTDIDEVLELARPYPGKMIGVYRDWHPFRNHSAMFPEAPNQKDVCQFENCCIFQLLLRPGSAFSNSYLASSSWQRGQKKLARPPI